MATFTQDVAVEMFMKSPDILVIADPKEGRFKCMNAMLPRVLGFSEDELLSKPYGEFVHADDREATARETERLAEGHPTFNFKNRYLAECGSYRMLEWNATPCLDLGLVYATARDITHKSTAGVSIMTPPFGYNTDQLLAVRHVDKTLLYSKLGRAITTSAKLFATLVFGRMDSKPVKEIPLVVDVDELLTAEQVALILGVPKDYVYRLSREGRIPTVFVGRYRRFRREDVRRWIEENRQN